MSNQVATQTRECELIINLTNMQQHVNIVGPKGEKTSVNIMPKKRVELTKGWSSCSNWQALNPKSVKVHKATAVDTSDTATEVQSTTTTQVATKAPVQLSAPDNKNQSTAKE